MDVREVLPPDAIPSIDDPTFGSEYVGEADDEVIVVDGQRARAYPVRILHYHDIVNDAVDGAPLAVTWCPLCGSAAVYERLVEGRELTFGVSGKLADDDLVLYDRETESEWKQSSGVCIAGEFEGTALTARPTPMRTYERFRERYPEGVVLQPPGSGSEAASDDDSASIDYDVGPYEASFEGDGFGLDAHRDEGQSREWTRDDLRPKERVLGVTVGATRSAFRPRGSTRSRP